MFDTPLRRAAGLLYIIFVLFIGLWGGAQVPNQDCVHIVETQYQCFKETTTGGHTMLHRITCPTKEV